MAFDVSRREWLRTGAIAAAGLAFGCSPGEQTGTTTRPGIMGNAAPPPDGTIKLNQNENPFGISMNAQQAIIDGLGQSHRYPGRENAKLRDMIAEREGVPKDYIVLGAGSTEIFRLSGLIYAQDGGKVLLASPSYFGFEAWVDQVEGKMVPVRLNDSYEHDLNTMTDRHTRDIGMVYVCNPNNPTGTIVDGTELKSFCENAAKKSLVYVDEAYNELVDDPKYSSMVDLIKSGHNIMVARTFSKIHGFAGLRVGYGIAQPDIVKKFRKIQTNFAPISLLSLRAAMASYQDTGFLNFCKEKNLEAINFTYKTLGDLGYDYLPSHTNFVLYKINRDAKQFVDEMKNNHKVVTRPIVFHEQQWNRVSMGTMDEMTKFAEALQQMT